MVELQFEMHSYIHMLLSCLTRSLTTCHWETAGMYIEENRIKKPQLITLDRDPPLKYS